MLTHSPLAGITQRLRRTPFRRIRTVHHAASCDDGHPAVSHESISDLRQPARSTHKHKSASPADVEPMNSCVAVPSSVLRVLIRSMRPVLRVPRQRPPHISSTATSCRASCHRPIPVWQNNSDTPQPFVPTSLTHILIQHNYLLCPSHHHPFPQPHRFRFHTAPPYLPCSRGPTFKMPVLRFRPGTRHSMDGLLLPDTWPPTRLLP